MTKSAKFGLAGASAMALLIAGATYLGGPVNAAATGDDVPHPAETGTLLTPPGITIEPLGRAQGYDTGKQAAAFIAREEVAFTNPRGLTLYTYELDSPGKSACVAACTESWLPAAPPADAQTFGPWSVITREDGTRQWAYKDKPLYTFAKDVDPGSVHGNSPARFGGRRLNGAGEYVGGGFRGGGGRGAGGDQPLPKEWKVALAFPTSDVAIPTGLTVKEVPDALGLVLVDHRDRTLYAFAGDPNRAEAQSPWAPAAAPQLAEATGDFGFVLRNDGVKQWTYKGKPLFSYAYDLAAGDANGIGKDKAYDVAAVYRYFMPDNVTVQHTLGQGKVLATAEGITLYRRAGHIFQSGGGHSLRRGKTLRPAVGRDIGLNVRCDEECRQVWHPYAAPEGAEPQGQWSVVVHPDGFRQWVYQGYGLWTYDGDKKPGDMNGNDTYLYTFADEAGTPADAARKEMVDFGTPMDGAPALYWTIAYP